MLLDSQHVMSDDQALTADAVSTNVIDLGAAKPAPGNSLRVKAHVTEAFNTLTSLNFIVQSSVDAAFTSPIVHQTINVVLANLTLGKVIDLGELPDGAKQYVRLSYDVVGSNPTLGKVTSFLTAMGGDQTFVGQE